MAASPVSRIATLKIAATASVLAMAAFVLGSCHTPEIAGRTALDDVTEHPGATPLPLLFRPISATNAVALNARIPFARGPNFPAPAFRLIGSPESRAAALDCLATAVYYESSGEPLSGQQAVAQVVLNRVRHPAFASSVCGVVYQGSELPRGCQFSFTCDGSLERAPDERGWNKALAVADAALSGFVAAGVGMSTHYHNEQVVPYWATSLSKDAKIGAHIFYRWPGALGIPAAFAQRYSSEEADSSRWRAAALISHGSWPNQSVEATAQQLRLVEHAGLDVIATINGTIDSTADARSFTAAMRNHLPGLVGAAGGEGINKDPSDSAKPMSAPTFAKADSFAAAASAASLEAAAYRPEPQPETLVRQHYTASRKAAARAAAITVAAASEWEMYTGAPVDIRKLLTDLAARVQQSTCPRTEASGGSTASPTVDGSADLLFRLSFADQIFSAEAPGHRAASVAPSVKLAREQIALAVFARIITLSQGPAAGQAVVRADVAEGYTLVPVLEQRLKEFERGGERFATLRQFFPVLMGGIPAIREDAAAERRTGDQLTQICAPAFANASS